MTRNSGRPPFVTRARNRLAALRARFARPAKGFVNPPEPRTIGHPGRGAHLIAGTFHFAGHVALASGSTIWDVPAPDAAFAAERQGFVWLDDLVAVGDGPARRLAQDWTRAWLRAFGRGRGPGWTPDLTGRRLIRLINHAVFLMDGQDRSRTRPFLASLTAQTLFLSRRWQATSPGLPRIEALTGLIHAGLTLAGMADRVPPATAALARECAALVDPQGAIASRNPQELLDIFTLLTLAAQALGETGNPVPPDHLAAMARIAPALRALRHADGGLARFHGGDAGLEGRLDTALAAAGVKRLASDKLAMGYARLQGGRTTVIADAAPPPGGPHAASSHASTLAFELTSGRRPLVVSCGPGAAFGADWHLASRATALHSTLSPDGFSSSRFGKGDQTRHLLADRARVTLARPLTFAHSQGVLLAHDGWSRTHGLTHGRELMLSSDGRQLSGQDELTALTPAERKRLQAMLARKGAEGLPFALRFHLHPDVTADPAPEGSAVTLTLKSGEVWVFRHDPGPHLSLEPSVFMATGLLTPRPTRQIVLSGRVTGPETRVVWTLAKAEDTPLAIRDTESP